MENDRKRRFLETFQRWERLFKRRDGGDVETGKWLIAEYYDSLRHLGPADLDMLTMRLKEACSFFPTIAECLAHVKPARARDIAAPPDHANAQRLADARNASMPRQDIEWAVDKSGGLYLRDHNEWTRRHSRGIAEIAERERQEWLRNNRRAA